AARSWGTPGTSEIQESTFRRSHVLEGVAPQQTVFGVEVGIIRFSPAPTPNADHGKIRISGERAAKRPPQSRTNESCFITSSRMFHGRMKTRSGFVRRISSGSRTGMRVPGR